ncbi:MAG: macro domain-containing protein [Mogibacterium sp.]|nr:macro domain-containing protein [Mogibacterium sp.]
MPFSIIRNDITKVHADAIVNTANPQARIGSGTDRAIYKAAGAEAMLAERRKIGDIPVGRAAATPAFALPAKYVIHTVGPAWVDGEHGELEALRSCYQESLSIAESLGCESIAFPLISTGVYGVPKDLALRTATAVIYDFLMQSDMMVYLVVFDRHAFHVSSKLFADIDSYIDENYVMDQAEEEYFKELNTTSHSARQRGRRSQQYYEDLRNMAADAKEKPLGSPTGGKKPASAKKASVDSKPATTTSFGDWVDKTQETFQEHLRRLIIERDMSNPEVYRNANITKQHFSKIMADKDAKPKKNTVCALALALRLTLPEAQALLASAGYALSPGSRFDLAVQYFLENKKYDITQDNIVLFDHGLELLGTL